MRDFITFLVAVYQLIAASVLYVVLAFGQLLSSMTVEWRGWTRTSARDLMVRQFKECAKQVVGLWARYHRFAPVAGAGIAVLFVIVWLFSRYQYADPPDRGPVRFDLTVLARIYAVSDDLQRHDINTGNNQKRAHRDTLSRTERQRRSVWLTMIGSGTGPHIDSLAYYEPDGNPVYYSRKGGEAFLDTFYRVQTNPDQTSRQTPYEAWDDDWEQYGKSTLIPVDTAAVDSLVRLHSKIFQQVEKRQLDEKVKLERLKKAQQKRAAERERKAKQIAEAERRKGKTSVDENDAAPKRPSSKLERVTKYLEENYEAAVHSHTKFGIPASVKLAQSIIEGGAGSSSLARKHNNHFGVKCQNKHGGKGWPSGNCKMYPVKSGCCVRKTDDDHCDKFKIYRSRQHSFDAHSSLLTEGRYKVLFLSKPPRWSDLKLRGNNSDDEQEWKKAVKNWSNLRLRWVHGLDALGYATDKKYSDTMFGVMRDYDLLQYDE